MVTTEDLDRSEVMNLLKADLPKWPALLVEGPAVTPEQAAVILVRTDSLYLTCNDHEWSRQCYSALGIEFKAGAGWPLPAWESAGAARERLGSLSLEYLHTHRIASSFIGGAHGWIDWEGNLEASRLRHRQMALGFQRVR